MTTQTLAKTLLSPFDLTGLPIISNPDLVERFANGWPLNPPADPSVWFSFDKEGYIDFPIHRQS